MKYRHFIFMLIASLVLAACGEAKTENTLVVSVEPQRALLEELVGDRFEVVTLLTPGANPETFEGGMGARRRLEGSTAYFTTGYLPFERKFEESLPSSVKIIDSAEGIEPVYGTHGHEHGEGEGHGHHHHHGSEGKEADPHVWTSVKNARIMARNMYNALGKIDPEGREIYQSRYMKLDARLDSLDKAFEARLCEGGVDKAFAIWHPSLSYLARDYGLEQIAVGFENKEMPAATLRKIIEEAKEEGVRVFFFQKEFDSRQASTLNEAMGTTLITINPLDYEWERQLDTIVSALCR